MQAETTGATVRPGYICVGRDYADHRTALVPADAVRNPHMAEDCGGRRAVLAERSLAVYVDCDLLPHDGSFGHSCQHRGNGRPPSIKVLVQQDGSCLEALSRLHAASEEFRPCRRRKGVLSAGTKATDHV